MIIDAMGGRELVGWMHNFLLVCGAGGWEVIREWVDWPPSCMPLGMGGGGCLYH